MRDVYDRVTRRRVMQSIRKKDTGPERRVRSALHERGLRFRLHCSDLPGSPDIVLPRHQVVVLVHGCFWHQHRCKFGKSPKSNLDYWLPKLARNRQRDIEVRRRLRKLDWRVVVIWECETLHPDRLAAVIERRLAHLLAVRFQPS